MRISPEDVQEFRFTVVKGAKPGAQISFEGGGTRAIRIGRAVDNELVIADPTVSRLHAKVDIRQDGWFLVDTGSSAGIEKMGFRVGQEPEPLESGDEFKLGETILRFDVVAKKGALKKVAAEAAGAKDVKRPAGGPSLLARIGLGSRRAQVVVGAAVVVLGALALWPQTPGLPPQASERPMTIDYGSTVGFFRNGDQSHADKAILELPTDAEGLSLYADVLGPAGIEIHAGRRPAGRLEPAKDWRTVQVVFIPRAVAKDKPLVVFDNLGYAAKQGDIDPAKLTQWGVAHAWLARVPSSSASLDQLGEELRGLRGLNDRIKDNLGYRWTILTGLRRSLVGLMKLSGQSVTLVPIPVPDQVPSQDVGAAIDDIRAAVAAEQLQPALTKLVPLLGQLEGDLSREYRRQMNELALAEKREDPKTVGTTLARLAKLLPENTDPRHRQLMAEIRKLRGPALRVYNDTFDRLGTGVSG
jgi:hypothetical protein